MSNATHWTERSTEDFLYSIASDFVEQLQSKMKALDNMTRAKLAKAAGISKGRISQVFNDPCNISLDTAIRLARALGLKISLMTYEDAGDPNNERGPVNSEIFNILWERAGRPFDMWDIQSLPQAAANNVVSLSYPLYGGWNNYDGRHAEKVSNVKQKPIGTIGWDAPMSLNPAAKGTRNLNDILSEGMAN